MGWLRAAASSDVGEAAVFGTEIGGVAVALYRLDGRVHATSGICTHALAFLKDGFVVDGAIECPLHQGLFDIRTGKALCAPLTRDLATYAVHEGDGIIMVDLDRAGEAARDEASASVASAADAQLHCVVIGAGQAAAAAIVAMRDAGFAGAITLVGEEAHPPYERPPLSKAMLTGEADAASCTRLDDAALAERGVAPRLGVRAEAIDPLTRTVLLSDGTRLSYDRLLIATGGAARRLGVAGDGLAGVHTLRTIEDCAAIASSLRQARSAVVVGAGFIGLELASSCVTMGVAVTVLEQGERPMARLLPAPIGDAFAALAQQSGVELRCGAAVDEIAQRGDRLVVRAGHAMIEADTVLVGVGLVVDTSLAQSAGCEVTQAGIIVDGEGRTSVEGIWAAGDCALRSDVVAGKAIRLESWQNAELQGAAAGRSIAGAEAAAHAPAPPWFWTDQFGSTIQMVGLPSVDDRVASAGSVGAVYHCIDRHSGVLSAVVAFNDAAAIRAARGMIGKPAAAEATEDALQPENDTMASHSSAAFSITRRYAWPEEGATAIPDWVYTDPWIYEREVERIFHGRTWNYVALEAEIPEPGCFIRSHVGPTPVVVSRTESGAIAVFENRCSHRAAEFCREFSGRVKEFVCPYHQWTYDLEGALQGVPFRRGVGGKGGMPADFKTSEHGPRRLSVTTHRGVVFASYAEDMESLEEYLGPEVLAEFDATFDGRGLRVLGHYRHTLPGNWKLYHENLKDPYHATLLHTFLVTFGLLVAGNKSLMLADASGRHGVMCSAKSDASKVSAESKAEMRAFKEGMTLADPRIMDFFDEFDSPWSVTMATIWPNLIVQREMNTLGIRQIVPTGPHEFIMKWTMFGFEGDSDEMTRHRLRQGNLMGPAGFLGLEDNEAMKFVQDGMVRVPGGQHYVALDPDTPEGTSETLISEAAIRGMYRHWREVMGL